ncbi:MAG: GNAT family N-acetyltransferase [Acidimicrobiales bacterium]|jgi:GNAT superfamily N-acetyltransferase
MTLSGAPDANFNLVVSHGGSAASLEECLEKVRELGAPTVVMLCGASLGNARQLADAGWICVGVLPFMATQLQQGSVDLELRRLERGDLPAFRLIFQSAYRVGPESSELAIPGEVGDETDGRAGGAEAWGLFVDDEMVSGGVTVAVGTNLCVFSMATPEHLQRHGYGRRLLSAVLTRGASLGLERALLNPSPAGEHLYRSAGFSVLEYWQVWSRRRWLLV